MTPQGLQTVRVLFNAAIKIIQPNLRNYIIFNDTKYSLMDSSLVLILLYS